MLGIQEHEFRIILGRTQIQFDPLKEVLNRKKHHYSLQSAANILERYALLGRPVLAYRDLSPRSGEYRYEMLSSGDKGNEILFFVVTMRPDELIRIISLRQASEHEKNYYLALTLHSTRTPPALSFALSQLPASSAPFSVSVQAGPLSFIRQPT